MGLGLGWEYPWLLREGALGMGQGTRSTGCSGSDGLGPSTFPLDEKSLAGLARLFLCSNVRVFFSYSISSE